MIGAINAGANAIYLAGSRFGARAYAQNFDHHALYEAIRYAHVRGVLVYVAINTVMYDEEIEDLITYTDALVKHNVDAFIVQDLGVMEMLIKRYPNVDIHASTQVNAHSVEQVKWLKNLGVKRIVLARETPINVIKAIKKQVDIEVEVFIHGALCVCYSGNCLMSSMIGGRSGNRGECAQPCRLPYKLYKDHQKITEQSYLLSTKDLMTIEYLDQLIELGVESLKIEGRMRKPEYVIQTVLSYRKALDNINNLKKISLQNDILKLKKVFNRDFTKGLMFNEKPHDLNHDLRPNHMGIELGYVVDYKSSKVTIKLVEPLKINDGYRILGNTDYGNTVSRIIKGKNIVLEAKSGDIITLDVTENIAIGSKVLKTSDYELEQSINHFLDENYKTVHLTGVAYAYVGSPLSFNISDGIHSVSVYSKEALGEAKTAQLEEEQLIDQLSKLGQTPFVFTQLDVKTDGHTFMSLKAINSLRREAIDQLIQLRTKDKQYTIVDRMDEHDMIEISKQPSFTVKVQTEAQYRIAKSLNFESIYVENISKVSDEDAIPVLKRIQLMKHEQTPHKVMIQDVGHLKHAKDSDIITDMFFNVTNIYTLYLLLKQGVKRVTLSPELSLDRIDALMKKFIKTYRFVPPVEHVVYGKTDLMITKYCPIAKTFKTNEHCRLCEKNQYYLEDRVGQKFPLLHDGHCNLRILHAKTLNLVDYVDALLNLGITCRMNLTVENDQESTHVLTLFKQGLLPLFDTKKMTIGRII